MNFFKRNWTKLAAVIIVGAVVFALLRIKIKPDPQTVVTSKDTIINPKIADIAQNLTLAGSIGADEIAVLRFQNAGKLVWVGVKVGDRVKKWQAVASLDKEQLRKNLQTQFNHYRTSLSQFQDTQDQYQLTKDKYLVTDTIQRILDRTQYSLDNSVITYEIADMAIKESTLVTPIAGVVVAVEQPLSGINITPANASFTIVNPESVYFQSEIDQEEVSKVKVGDRAQITIDSFQKTFDSQITYISFLPVSGQSSTVYQIKFGLPISNNHDLSYRLGMDGDATITLQQASQAITVPSDAVYNDNATNNYYVLVKNGSFLTRRNVKIGIENDTDIQILEGLSPHESVVIKKK